MACPVIDRAASLHSHNTAAAISCGSPNRAIGVGDGLRCPGSLKPEHGPLPDRGDPGAVVTVADSYFRLFAVEGVVPGASVPE